MSDASSASKIPVTVLVMTKNEEANLPRCLESLSGFYQVVVVDSYSRDRTADIAREYGALMLPYSWNGMYPKKREWSLHNAPIPTEWVLFVDADEVVTPELKDEIARTINENDAAAFFIYGQPVYAAKMLQHGRWNNKIVLFRNGMLSFPDMKDEQELNMGEIEGHYQPLVKGRIGQLQNPMIHYGPDNKKSWDKKHDRYAKWMAWMIQSGKMENLYGTERGGRYWIKRLFLKMPCLSVVAFLDSYILKRGFLDGMAGLGYALSRARYYRMIKRELRN